MRLPPQITATLLAIGIMALAGCTSSGTAASKTRAPQNRLRPYNPNDPRPNYGSIFPLQADLQAQAITKQKQDEAKAKADAATK
jgi:hypothetical protein